MKLSSLKKFKKPVIISSAATLVIVCLIVVFVCIFVSGKPQEKPVAKLPSSSAAVRSSSQALPVPTKMELMKQAKKENSDTIGWLTVPGTTIDMAVVQTDDNSFYLKHNLKKKYYWKGWPFLDYRDSADPLPRNAIIYGHNMGDGMLFGQLKMYNDVSFLNKNPVIYFGTGTGDHYWKIFAVYTCSVDFYYIDTDFSSDKSFGRFLNSLESHSIYKTDVDVTPQDKIITLSTCTYEFKNARFVVQARLVRPGESVKVGKAKVK